MSDELKTNLVKEFNIPITKNKIDQIVQYCKVYELRKTHIDALNTSLLGVYKMHFLPVDYEALFNIFEIDKNEFNYILKSLDCINKDYQVRSDAYNILSVYLVYRIKNSNLPSKLKYDGCLTILKMLNYKFFTSFVNHMLRHGANREIMEATINSLSDKFDIKNPKTPTWRLVIEKRCEDILDKQSIHYKVFNTFEPDEKVFYIITDIQTRIRTKIKIIINLFHKNKDLNLKIKSYDSISEIDGEKVIREIENSLSVPINNITNIVANTNVFLDFNLIKLIVGLNKNITETLLTRLLDRFSDMAVVQNKLNEQMKVEQKSKDIENYIGYKILISNIIQKTYRLCILDKSINMKSKLMILKRTEEFYKSSRIANSDILNIKRSVDLFINTYFPIKRESTAVSLRSGFICYIMCLSFKYM